MRLSGSAVFNVNGTGDNGLWVGETGTGRLSVSGNAALNFAATNNGIQLGRNAAGVGTANLLGGNVTTPRIAKGAGTGTLNFNGGTLTANAASATFLTGLTNAYVYGNGGIIANGGNAITIGQALLEPTGNGVSASGLTVSGSGFIAAPLVQITGGDGTGATAVAEVDASGNLTGITITNPGTGYTTPPTFTLVGGGIGNTGSIGGAATLVANTSGGLTFTGSATTILSAPNTYTGNTVVSGGTTLAVSSTGGLTFKPGANGISNKVTGAGTASFEGTFTIDLTGATIANGNSWTLVDVASKSYSGASFSVSGFTEASDVWTKVDGSNTWTFSETTGVLSLAVSTGGGYSSWIGGFGLAPADQDATDDPDGDGIANFLEYALGGDPSVREPALLPTGSKSGSDFVLSFSRSDLAMSNGDAPLSIEYGTTLGSWTTINVPASSGTVSGVAFNVTAGSPNDAITATIPTAGAGKFFARVKAGN
jgi:autotransporter-associated beta strand protein